MKHCGDITKINGSDVPIVDIVTGGSPCQDLSIAGKRAGLEGARSGLFMEQIRVIKEMRDECKRNAGANFDVRLIKPRYMVWENVAGAFSSNKGEDFRAVLEETAKIADENAVIPRPENGKWQPCGCIMGDGYSIAWRVHDAQFWGVPQRRKRICLLADFNGDTAPRILFELRRKTADGEAEQAIGHSGAKPRSEVSAVSQGMSGNSAESREEGQETTAVTGKDAETAKQAYGVVTKGNGDAFINPNTHTSLTNGGGEAGQGYPCVLEDKCLNPWDTQQRRIQPENGKANSLPSAENRYGGGESYVMQSKVYGISGYESNAMKSSNPHSGIYEAETTRTLDNNGGNPACNQGGMIVLEGNGSRDSHKGDGYKESETMYTLNTVEQHAVCIGNGQVNDAINPSDEVCNTLNCMVDPMKIMTVSQDAYDKFSQNDKSASLKACGGTYGGAANH